MRILGLGDVNEWFELIYAQVDDIYLILPFGFLEDVLEEKKLESVEEELFCKSAKQPLDEESQERMLIFIFEIMVGQDGHPVDNHLDLLIEEELLILEAFLGITLGIT